jgi:hypothetical protein
VKKPNLAVLLMLFAVAPAKAEHLQASELRLKPSVQCKGTRRHAPKMKETIHSESVDAVASDTDLNGDGWCDWIIPLPYPTNTGLPEYPADEAILLGTVKGARTFGNLDRLKSYWKKKLPVPDGLVLPTGVTGMAPMLVAYVSGSNTPYFMGFSGSYPDFWSDAESYGVYKWNQEFDMPQEVSKSEYATVMKFWQHQYCTQRKYSNQDFLHPDSKNPERPLEIFVCAPWVSEAIRRAERDSEKMP